MGIIAFIFSSKSWLVGHVETSVTKIMCALESESYHGVNLTVICAPGGCYNDNSGVNSDDKVYIMSTLDFQCTTMVSFQLFKLMHAH